MENPSTPPRHQSHGAPAARGGLFGGRRAARIRALANSSQIPEERALADALVLTAWLTSAQRATYAVSLRALESVDDFAVRLADERRVVLEEGADRVCDEVSSAAEAEQAARQRGWRVLETALVLVALGCVVALIVLGVTSDETGVGAIPLGSWPLAVVAAAALTAAAIVGRVATRLRDRALLDWAVSRPGQLGRGLPLARPLQRDSAGPAILRALLPALLVAAGVIAICAGAAILLITLLRGDESALIPPALWSLGGGVAALLLAVLCVHLRSRRLEQIARRVRATEWFGTQDPAGR
ncbi:MULTISPECIES: hypothetical protein [unclassified Brachybacterium]|uniref:hypothetical protein n=1 Tax=unclassified Brachybacterium TaxID=2623841 RepID=UPI0036212D57